MTRFPAATGSMRPVSGVWEHRRLELAETSPAPVSTRAVAQAAGVSALRLALVVRARLRRARPDTAPASGLETVLALARTAEGSGYDAFFLDGTPGVIELHGEAAAAQVDPFVLLGAVAASTGTIRVGCLASPLDERPPALLAKVVSSLDVCSRGRALLALRPAEPRGGEDESDLERLAEALEVCRALLRVTSPSFAGRHLRLEKAFNEPRAHRREDAVPVALEVPATQPEDCAAAVLDLAARFAELCVLDLGIGAEPASRLSWALGLLGPLARRAGRLDGEPTVIARLPARGLDVAQLAEQVIASRAAGAAGVVIDWSSCSVAPEDVAGLGRLVCAQLGPA
jgi:hypothetical protein